MHYGSDGVETFFSETQVSRHETRQDETRLGHSKMSQT